jgi:hypothetical protein
LDIPHHIFSPARYTTVGMLCCRRFRTDFVPHIDASGLSSEQKSIIIDRYVPIVEEERVSYILIGTLFKTCKALITIGSIITAILASVSYSLTLTEAQKENILITTVVFSAIILASNQIMSDGLSKKYVLSELVYEKQQSEGWRFVSKVKPYDVENPTTAFKLFIDRVETMNMKSNESLMANDTGDKASDIGNIEQDISSDAPPTKKSNKVRKMDIPDVLTGVPRLSGE